MDIPSPPSRYVMITHHSLYARIYKKHWIAMMLVFCWLFSYGMQLPTLLNVWGKHYLDMEEKKSLLGIDLFLVYKSSHHSNHIPPPLCPGIFGYDDKLGTCSILKDSNGRSSKTALFVIAFVIPCIIIVICYTRIFWVVHK